MQFNDDNKAILDSLTPMEAEAYLQFLEEEKRRHRLERTQAESRAKYYHALARFYESAVARHNEDIEGIGVLASRIWKEVIGERTA